MVIPFHECIARPDEGGRPFPLTAHLLNVASALGAPEGDKAERLAFLAGWMHDVGKARWQWQRYIRRQDESKHVPHSVYGGVLFAYCAHHLFQQWKTPVHEQLLLQGQAIQWIRDILDHHGTLKDLDKHHLPWEGNFFSGRIGRFGLERDVRLLETVVSGIVSCAVYFGCHQVMAKDVQAHMVPLGVATGNAAVQAGRCGPVLFANEYGPPHSGGSF